MGKREREVRASELAVLERLRGIAREFPDVEERRDGFGHFVFAVGKKSLAILGEDDGAPSLALKADPQSQQHLIARGGFHRTPYIGHHGWVSVSNTSTADWAELRELFADAYRASAPKRASKAAPPKPRAGKPKRP